MLKVALCTLIVVLAVVCAEAKGGKKGKDKPEGRQAAAKDCSPWTYEECTLEGDATCGQGTKKGTRTGDNCPVKEKSFSCKVPCAKNKCKYQKGEWSECDATTNTMTRTKTLKKGDATLCQASKVVTRKCKNQNVDKKDVTVDKKDKSEKSDKGGNRRRKGGSE